MRISKTSPRFFLILIFSFFSFSLFSERYQISDVSYTLDKTREQDLRRVVPVNTEKIFESKEELDSYLADLRQRLMNTRAFDDVQLEAEYEQLGSEDINIVFLNINAKDSKHLLILPYPKYDSNNGLIFKIKAKNVNFLGTLNTMNAGIFAGLKEDLQTGNQNLTFGAEFNYSYPFQTGPFSGSWNNLFDFEYTKGVNELEFQTGTGFTFELPFQRFALVFDIKESLNRDLEYTNYDDTQYFTSDVNFSVPVKLFDIANWGYVYWTPFIDGKVNYDKNGISANNDDLASPVTSIGQNISTSRINWYENYRTGFSCKLGHSVGYDFMQNEIEPRIYAEIQAFKSFKYFGINTRLNAFLTKSNREEIGEYIRGLRDEQKYINSAQKKLKTKLALKTPCAIAFNLDFPFHIITTNWLDWSDLIFGEESWFSRTFAWTDRFNFELQASPFIDVALTKNEITGRLFLLKDGWYTGGLELLVFPERWKGIVMRASIGFDLGRTVIAKKYPEKIDMSWRENIKKYEIYAGIGLHY